MTPAADGDDQPVALRGILTKYDALLPAITTHLEHVVGYLQRDPVLAGLRPLITFRIKDRNAVADKVRQKHDPETREITPESLLQNIEDLAGARLIVHHRADVELATRRLEQLADEGAWRIAERNYYPPLGGERAAFADEGIRARHEVTLRPGYSSRHFLLLPTAPASEVRCELQVRTVLEEAIYENQRRLVYHHDAASPYVAQVMEFLADSCAAADALLEKCYEWSPGAVAEP